MRAFAILGVVILLLAGCTGNGNGSNQDPNEDVFDDAPTAASGKGLIRGLVLTSALVPVPDATIQLTSASTNQTSDENGAFVFVDLEPGTYFMQVSKPGWTSIQQQADVVADVQEPTIVKVTLQKLPGSEPRVETYHQEGYISCSFGTYVNYGGCSLPGQPQSAELYFDVVGIPSAVQTEVIWDSTQPSGEWVYLVQGFCSCGGSVPDTDGARYDELPDATSPHVARANDTFLRKWTVGESEDVAQLVVSVSASGPEPQTTNGSGVAVNQAFEVYATFFWNILEPDPDWTFGNNGPYPVPSEG